MDSVQRNHSILRDDSDGPVLAESDNAKIKGIAATPSANVLQIEVDSETAGALMANKLQWKSVTIAIVGNQLDMELPEGEETPAGESLPGMDDADELGGDGLPPDDSFNEQPKKERKKRGPNKKK